jgi:A/G-specific adenine glycosylase
MLSLDDLRTLKQAVRRRLLAWYEKHQRDLPWRRTRDPYRILVSEVMLQQTRVAAVEPYYRAFLRRFPAAAALAAAPESSVLHAWSGLGYYSRARNLRAAARRITEEGFPSTYEGLLELPGVGPYTAAALASIVLGQPYAVFDGNVRRVLSRLLADPRPRQEQADDLLDRRRPAGFNQAIMELGALVCRPRRPDCPACPLAGICRARRQGQVDRFPPPRPKPVVQRLALRMCMVRRGRSVLLAPPSGGGFWPQFWTLPDLPLRDARLATSFTHTVTFRKIAVQVWTGRPVRLPKRLRWIRLAQLARLPLATPARRALAAL